MEFFKNFRLLLILLFISSFSFSQIETGKVKSKEEKKEKEKKSKEKAPRPVKEANYDPGTVFYLGGSLGYGYRTLKPNDGYFGEPLGERQHEEPLFTGGAALGMRTRLASHLYLDFGIALAKNGEQYSYEDASSDSSYAYKTHYTQFAVPVKLQFVTGKKVRFVAAAGLQPQMFLGYRQTIKWTDSDNVNSTQTIKDATDINLFTIAGVANAGIEWQFSKAASLYLLPEFRYQLNSTFGKQAPYIHKGSFYGLQFGFSFGF